MVWWEAILAYVGGPAVVLGAIGFLVKYLLDKSFERDKEKREVEAERFRHELKLIALEHSVRFGELHPRRAEYVQRLFNAFVDARSKIHLLVRPIPAMSISARAEHSVSLYADADRSLIALSDLIPHSGLYFSDEMNKNMREAIELMHRVLSMAEIVLDGEILDWSQDGLEVFGKKILSDAHLLMEQQFSSLEKQISREFKTLLGVTNSD
ncbi:MAG: hypothetical protein H6813_06140 [Phycisphaeraceae bacterium]|nr:hypothetical protein [Phycisphaeraceae bacterium]MCB9848050.1 hypothetical protein [Phycisphaeraceae bacterium]